MTNWLSQFIRRQGSAMTPEPKQAAIASQLTQADIGTLEARLPWVQDRDEDSRVPARDRDEG